ncbi:MAG: metalloregulator ArsR/SmtB family transcription factor [Proteobacteria bacterium]|nr:metalloregulator ArsR/SmtB family transcription factor [Pseudomonadota bacterium]
MNTTKAAKIFKALSHPNRLELYLEIAGNQESNFEPGEECLITDIIGALNIGAPTISHHLKELSNADLITTERRGKFLVARANRSTLLEVIQLLGIDR